MGTLRRLIGEVERALKDAKHDAHAVGIHRAGDHAYAKTKAHAAERQITLALTALHALEAELRLRPDFD